MPQPLVARTALANRMRFYDTHAGFDYHTEAGAAAAEIEFLLPEQLQSFDNVAPGQLQDCRVSQNAATAANMSAANASAASRTAVSGTAGNRTAANEAAASSTAANETAASRTAAIETAASGTAAHSSAASCHGKRPGHDVNGTHPVSSKKLHVTSASTPTWLNTMDYCNGGPFFHAAHGSLALEHMKDVTVLARYASLPGAAAAAAVATQHCELLEASIDQGQWQSASSNPLEGHGTGNHATAPNGAMEHGIGWQLGPAAALRVNVGMGVAVLCGTHPELEPEWLDASGSTGQVEKVHADGASAQPSGMQQDTRNALGPSMAVCTGATNAAANGATHAAASSKSQSAAGVAEQDRHSTLGSIGTVNSSMHSSSQPCDEKEPWEGADQPIACTALSQHSAELKHSLTAAQPERDLFLSCLLLAALYRT